MEAYCSFVHQSLWKNLALPLYSVTRSFSFNPFTLISATPTLPAIALQLRILMNPCCFRRERALTHCQTLEEKKKQNTKNNKTQNPLRICLSQHFKIEELNHGSWSQQSSVVLRCLKATAPPKQLWKKALCLCQAKLAIMSPSPKALSAAGWLLHILVSELLLACEALLRSQLCVMYSGGQL